jgi:hypothetical protein
VADQERVDRIEDPKRLRALAHPLRWGLLDYVGSYGPVTATRCAEALGESVASCSYHLNILAKYGFIEEAPGSHGRERPWQATSHTQTIGGLDMDTETHVAARAAGDALIDRHVALIKDHHGPRYEGPEEWRKANTVVGSTLFITAEEAEQLRTDLMALADRFNDRLADASLRPPDAREVRLFLATTLIPDRAPKS